MEDFTNILHRDYGLKPQGKSAPMSATKSGHGGGGAASFPFFSSSPSTDRSPSSNNSTNAVHRSSSPDILSEGLYNDPFFGGNAMKSSSKKENHASKPSHMRNGTSIPAFDDVFGGLPKFDPSPKVSSSQSFDDALKPSSNSSTKVYSQTASNNPRYDDDVFGGVHNADHDDIFNVESNSVGLGTTSFDDLLGAFGSSQSGKSAANAPQDTPMATDSVFDELLRGFGGASMAKPQPSKVGLKDPFADLQLERGAYSTSRPDEDPFRIPDPISYENSVNDFSNGYSQHFSGFESKLSTHPGTTGISHHSTRDTGRHADSPLGFFETSPSKEGIHSRETYWNNSSLKQRKKNPSSTTKPELDTFTCNVESGPATSPFGRSSPVNGAEAASTNFQSQRCEVWESASHLSHLNNQKVEQSMPDALKDKHRDESWITIEYVKLLTQPTSASPPSRPPPAPPANQKCSFRVHTDSDRDNRQDVFSTSGHLSQQHTAVSGFRPTIGVGCSSSDKLINEHKEFASGGSRLHKDLKGGKMPPSPTEEDQMEGSAAATASGAAMKEAIERAEAKLRQAKEAKDRERGESKSASFREQSEEFQEAQEKEFKRQAEMARDDQERAEREAEAKERWRIEREKEKEREQEIEKERGREKDRIAAEKANEAREKAAVERATAEARERAAEKAAERAAVDRAASEARARARAERAAVERATAEARERAASEARGRAEKMAAERAATEAREREAAAQRNGNDLEAFFMATSRPASAPKQRTQTGDSSSIDNQQSNKGFSSGGHWRSANTRAAVKQTPSASSTADDLASIFGGPATSTGFQEVEGEARDRRDARLDRYQRTLDRAAKALEEKQRRDLMSEREQAERHRAADLVDSEIKRWAAGKEGNLRALLSTLQYVLWPECGWQPVSLTELITAAAVKKVYRKATLYVHPDKVQQKGATIQQKYIAEKIFDLLKEAWNKFNAEELF